MHVNSSMSGDNDNEAKNPIQLRRGSMNKLILLNNIRLRLLEQLCFLDVKAESHSYFVKEMSTFFRHRALVESEHSLGLERILNCFQYSQFKLSKNYMQWPYSCWNLLIKETYSLSSDYNLLSEIYNAEMMIKLQNILHIYKKYYELISETHDETLRMLRNFYTTITTYTIYQKNHSSSWDTLETIKTRNILKHFTETLNADVHKNMLRDLRDIIYSMDLGFGLMISKAILAHVSSEQKRFQMKLKCQSEEDLSSVDNSLGNLNFRKKLIEQNNSIVLRQKNLRLIRQLNKEKNDNVIENLLQFEFMLQTQLLSLKEKKLRKNLEVIYGILDTLEMKTENLTIPEKRSAHENRAPVEMKSKISSAKSLSNSSSSNVIKQIGLKTNLNSSVKDVKGKFISAHSQPRPKLFGGSLEEYIKITNEQIPLIMRSCIRVISTYGLHSQGIFRVSGSKIDIMNFRECFENGEDPLAGATDAADMNSVAGVLKLYLRELQEPLFPSKYFNFFISLKQMDSEHEAVREIRNFFTTISKPIVIVIRYLFSFLNHLSEYASENLMDAFNLAISFGPTLMPTPEDRKQVQYQTQLNELIKFIIINHQEVFPKELGGPQYHKIKAENYLSDSSNNAAEL